MKKRDFNDWRGGYLPADKAALRMFAQTIFLRRFVEQRPDALAGLRPIITDVLLRFVAECEASGINPFELTPAFVEFFRPQGELDEWEKGRTDCVIWPGDDIINAVREQARVAITDWCDGSGLRDEWFSKHVAAVLRRCCRDRAVWLSHFWFMSGAYLLQLRADSAETDPTATFRHAFAGAMTDFLAAHRAVVGIVWEHECEWLEHKAERERALPGERGSFAQMLADRCSERWQPPQSPFDGEDIRLRLIEASTFHIVPRRVAFPCPFPFDGERARKTIAAAGANLHVIWPRYISRTLESGGLKSRKQFLAEVKTDFERCCQLALSKLPKRYQAPVDLRRSFIKEAWERCEASLREYNQQVEEQVEQNGYEVIEARKSFDLHCGWLLRYLSGATYSEIAGDDPRPDSVAESSVGEAVRELAQLLDLPLARRKGRPRKTRVESAHTE